MTFRLILWFSLAWLPILMFFYLRNETKFKKNIVVEVTLPYEARTDRDVKFILQRFKRTNLWINLFMFLVTIPFLFIKNTSLTLTAWMTWLLFALIVPVIPYVRTNVALKRLKVERGWKRDDNERRYVDLSAFPSPKWTSPWVFIPAIILTFSPILWDLGLWPLYLTLGLSTVLFYFSYRYLYRDKSEMVDRNITLTRVLTQVRRHNWGTVWLVSAYSFAALSLIFALVKYRPIVQIITISIVTLVVIVLILRVEFKVRGVQEKLTAESGKDWYVDDDDYWPGGIFYYNPNDNRLLINTRVGINSTINLAKTSGKMIAVLIALILLLMPLTGLFVNLWEKQPLSLELTENTLIAHRGSKKEILNLSEISKIQLLDELPEHMTRNWGTASDQLMSGRYTASGLGSIQLSLDPKAAPFLLIELNDGSRYLFGSRQPGEAEAIFHNLNKHIK
jgi:hypothetical protein